MRKFFQRLLYGGRPRLEDYEINLLKAVEAELPRDQADCLQLQIEAIDVVQRGLGGRRVAVFVLGAKKESVRRFENRQGEVKLARLEITAGEWEGSVAVMLYDGLLSSLEFSRPPTKEAFDLMKIAKLRVFPEFAG